MAKIIKRTKKDGTCSYCIRVSNGYDWQGRQVLVNRTFTPPPGLTGKKLEKELQRQADAFEQEVHSGISLDASMSMAKQDNYKKERAETALSFHFSDFGMRGYISMVKPSGLFLRFSFSFW